MFAIEDNIYPFWGHFPSASGGRDPLAVQNSSVVIYTTMIEGITNVTLRVRYNGFYCWLLNLIGKNIFAIDASLVDSKASQMKYLRRAELLLAYIMTNIPEYQSVTGVSGSIYAQNHPAVGDIFNLAKGADVENGITNTYWRNSMGIFGQYYVGVLMQLGLVCPPDSAHHTYRSTTDGDKLADAFGNNIPIEKAELFWKSIYKGNISLEELTTMREFALHSIPEGVELETYRRIIRGKDSINYITVPTQYRIQSIKLLASFIDRGNTTVRTCVNDFLRYNFEQVIEKDLQVDIVPLAWFLYEFDELAHTAYESFHFGLLYLLADDPLPLEMVFDEIERGIKDLSEADNIDNLSDFLNSEMSIHEIYQQMFVRNLQREGIQRIYDACHLLIKLHSTLGDYYPMLFEFAARSGFGFNRRGYAPELVDGLVSGKEELPIATFVVETLYRAINDHTYSSYQKSSIDGGLVHNYIIDDDTIRRLRKTNAVRTSPRLQSVLYYMEDLKWISRKDNRYVVKGDIEA
ncbi:MAG: hypothetical protein Q4A54_10350 [Parabacteroides sp.]|nr:hypothetical protein [Parabacteroides sp.]